MNLTGTATGKILGGIAIVLLVAWGFLSFYPVVYLFVTSFRIDADILNRPFALDGPFELDNYYKVITGSRTSMSVLQYALNSVIVTAATLVLLIFVSSLAGYALARGNFRYRAGVQQAILLFLAVPAHVLVVPIYVFFGQIGMRDNLLGMIMLYTTLGLPFTVLLMRAYFVSFPKELEEAAALDGCSRFGTFWRIVLPVSRGPIASMAIINVGWIWSELFFGLTLLGKTTVRTLPLAIAAYRTDQMSSESVIGQLFAIMTIAVVPMLIVYLVFQSQIQKGMTAGAIK
jgi:raffinose/stachyose/melibiose transport system permease protein